MIEMLQAVFDSFMRSIIRFWDNRFIPKDDYTLLFHEEISYLRRRNEELQNFILNSIEPKTAQESESEISEEQLQSIGRPIETTLQKRRRFEAESLAKWNKDVQEAREAVLKSKQGTTKTNEELESEVLKVKN